MSLKNLKIIMKTKGCSVDELSEKSGIPKSTINKIICGATPDPRYSTMKQLVNSLNLTVDELVDYLDLSADGVEKEISSPEWSIIQKYRSLDEHGKRIVHFILSEEASRVSSDHNTDL